MLKHKRVSIKEIAKRAGTSHSTVSRALSGSTLISVNTRRRVQRIADEMGYTPDAIAQSLKRRRTRTIGLVVSLIADPFWGGVVEGIEQVAVQADLSILLNSSNNDPDREIQLIETFQRRRVDGMVVASSRLSDRYTRWLKEINIPVVMISTQIDGDRGAFRTVNVDNQIGAQLAVDHLIQLGHTRIGYVGVKSRPAINSLRLKGYRLAMENAGLTPKSEWEVVEQIGDGRMVHELELANTFIPDLLDAGVSAIFCYNDLIALGAMSVCHAQNIQVPQACSIIGFDDIEPARYVSPSLTTVHQPNRDMGRYAMKMLLDLMEGLSVEDCIITPELKIRESTTSPLS